MTGSDVLPIRSALGLNPWQLAAILGIHVSSVYRWESTPGPKGIRSLAKGRKRAMPAINPLQAELLSGLRAVVDKGIGAEIGEKIKKALLAGGSLAGLRVALDAILKEIPHG